MKQAAEKRGKFRACLQRAHLYLVEETEGDSSLVKTIHSSVIKHEVCFLCHDSHPKFQPDGIDLLTQAHASYLAQTTVLESLTSRKTGWQLESFICGEDIGTEFTPQCGSCRWGKCFIVGHNYSFTWEEQEVKLIQDSLEYNIVK